MAKGRPKLSQAQSESRKQALIDIAKRLFIDEGYQSVSMRKIASQANISPMTLYQSFENKRDILRYIWTDIFTEVSNQCKASIKPSKDEKDQLFDFCEAFLGYWLEHPNHYRVVYLESDKLESKGDTYFAENAVIIELFELLASLLVPLGIREKDLDSKVKLLVLQMQGIAHGLITISEISWGEPRQLIRNCLERIENNASPDTHGS